MTVLAGSTGVFARVKVFEDTGGSNPGQPKTDITSGTAGLSIKYQVDNGTVVTLTPAAMSPGGAHVAGGIYHRANGDYVIGVADAAFANPAIVEVWTELTDTDCRPDRIQVVQYDPNDGNLGTEIANVPRASTSLTAGATYKLNKASESGTELEQSITQN